MTSGRGFTGRQAADVAGITYRQLDYWARTDLIRPSVAEARGSGSLRRYSYRDLVLLRIVRTLLDGGLNLERIRAAFEAIRDITDLTGRRIVVVGHSIEVVRDGQELLEVITRRSGDGILHLLDVDAVCAQVDAGLEAMLDG